MIPGTDACCILLYGDIGEYDDNVRSGDIARELLEAEALTGKVDVRINSNGGEVYSGIAIFNALKNSKADITIYVDGIAASAASESPAREGWRTQATYGWAAKCSAPTRPFSACRAMRRCRLSSPRLMRKAFCGDWMEPRSRMSWAVALVM